MAKGGEVLLSHSAYAYVAKDLKVRNSYEVQMKGMHETTELYVVEDSGETPAKAYRETWVLPF
jgi:class 3 adenylate cyclase